MTPSPSVCSHLCPAGTAVPGNEKLQSPGFKPYHPTLPEANCSPKDPVSHVSIGTNQAQAVSHTVGAESTIGVAPPACIWVGLPQGQVSAGPSPGSTAGGWRDCGWLFPCKWAWALVMVQSPAGARSSCALPHRLAQLCTALLLLAESKPRVQACRAESEVTSEGSGVSLSQEGPRTLTLISSDPGLSPHLSFLSL